MPTVLITGCDYGIGFEFARQYAEDGWTVHAVCLDGNNRVTVDTTLVDAVLAFKKQRKG